MEVQLTGRKEARYLSQIQEESSSREQSCFLPPIVQPAVEDGGRQEVRRPPMFEHQQQQHEDNKTLLEELGRIEAELRESLRVDVERQQEVDFLRQQENKQQRTNLCYLSLSQRVAKPWVSSYFRKFPMHIYCLPVQPANHRGRRRGLKKRK